MGRKHAERIEEAVVRTIGQFIADGNKDIAGFTRIEAKLDKVSLFGNYNYGTLTERMGRFFVDTKFRSKAYKTRLIRNLDSGRILISTTRTLPRPECIMDIIPADGTRPMEQKRMLMDLAQKLPGLWVRRGEILGLKWDYIRLDNRLIILPVTKNNTVRVLPINDTLYRILSEMPEKTGYVFGNGNGGHIGDIKHSFTSACRKAGISDFRFHDLRHTYASHLAMRGVHIRALQELLGHKTLAMTQRYSHLAPEQLQNAVKLLDGVIGERRELVREAASK